MGNQLSLFDQPVDITVEVSSEKGNEPILITVISVCAFCKTVNTIGPHIPIHSFEWMRENWKESTENVFVKFTGFCSRECEQKSKKNVLKSK